jgi:cation transport regulator
MPYESIDELPKSVRNLPSRAKSIYLKAFNSACEECDESGSDMAREKAAHEAAWAAVKLEYEKDEETGEWVKLGESSGKRSRHVQRQRRKSTGGSASQQRAHA